MLDHLPIFVCLLISKTLNKSHNVEVQLCLVNMLLQHRLCFGRFLLIQNLIEIIQFRFSSLLPNLFSGLSKGIFLDYSSSYLLNHLCRHNLLLIMVMCVNLTTFVLISIKTIAYCVIC